MYYVYIFTNTSVVENTRVQRMTEIRTNLHSTHTCYDALVFQFIHLFQFLFYTVCVGFLHLDFLPQLFLTNSALLYHCSYLLQLMYTQWCWGAPTDLNSFGVRISDVKAIFTECFGFEHFLTSIDLALAKDHKYIVLANIFIHI